MITGKDLGLIGEMIMGDRRGVIKLLLMGGLSLFVARLSFGGIFSGLSSASRSDEFLSGSIFQPRKDQRAKVYANWADSNTESLRKSL